MSEEEKTELLKFLMTDYGRGYLAGLVSGLSVILKILKKSRVSSPLSSNYFDSLSTAF